MDLNQEGDLREEIAEEGKHRKTANVSAQVEASTVMILSMIHTEIPSLSYPSRDIVEPEKEIRELCMEETGTITQVETGAGVDTETETEMKVGVEMEMKAEMEVEIITTIETVVKGEITLDVRLVKEDQDEEAEEVIIEAIDDHMYNLFLHEINDL